MCNFYYESPSPTSPGAKPNQSKPIWHRLPNLESSTNLSPHKRSPAPTRSPWGTKTSQMGVTNPATPNCRPTVSTPPDHHFWHCLHLFTTAPNPCLTAPLYYTPLPSHPAPSASQPPYPPTQNTLLLILTSPGTTAIFCFFWWWGLSHMHL